jgi:CheY-like chemotaxis protein
MPTALIVDDNRQMADGIARILDLFSVRADVAYGARTGLLRLQEMTPDVIFLDINMPGFDGFEVLAYFRRLPQFENIPVIVVTSDDQPETAQKVKETGVISLIIKPPTVDDIENALRMAKVIL